MTFWKTFYSWQGLDHHNRWGQVISWHFCGLQVCNGRVVKWPPSCKEIDGFAPLLGFAITNVGSSCGSGWSWLLALRRRGNSPLTLYRFAQTRCNTGSFGKHRRDCVPPIQTMCLTSPRLLWHQWSRRSGSWHLGLYACHFLRVTQPSVNKYIFEFEIVYRCNHLCVCMIPSMTRTQFSTQCGS